MREIHLQMEHLAVGYRGKALVRGIEIGVRRGEIVTLVGPNGSGKSTILKSITRQLSPVEGAVLLADAGRMREFQEMQKMREIQGTQEMQEMQELQGSQGMWEMKEIQGVQEMQEIQEFQEMQDLNRLSPAELARRMAVMLTGRLQTELMTCRDVAAMGRYPYTGRLGILSGADEEKVDRALEAVHAQDLSERLFDAVSDGERQRILLARAICQEPEIIVLDEPTSYLDIRHKMELLSILYRMAKGQGITVVMSLHEIDLARKISDRVVCVRGGEIFACGKPSEVLDGETVRRLYDLDPALGRFDAATGSLDLFFVKNGRQAAVPGGEPEGQDSAAGCTSGKQSMAPGGEPKSQESAAGCTTERQAAAPGRDPKSLSQASAAGPAAGKSAEAEQKAEQKAENGRTEERYKKKQKAGSTAGTGEIPRLMLAASGSGSGKTLLTCGLLRILQKQGLRPAAFKCGPDYIDPMFHREALGIPSRNLDTFFQPDGQADEALRRAVRKNGADIALVEGVMGYFDGTGKTGREASSFELAVRTRTPVVLVVDAKGMGRSVVPLIQGFAEYEKKILADANMEGCREPISHGSVCMSDTTAAKTAVIEEPISRNGKCAFVPDKNGAKTPFIEEEPISRNGKCAFVPDKNGVKMPFIEETGGLADGRIGQIRGIFLNRVSAGMFPMMKNWIETETGLAVVGYLPQEEELAWGSRHLGLLQPEEIEGLQEKIDALSDRLAQTADLRKLLEIAKSAGSRHPMRGGRKMPQEIAGSARSQKQTACGIGHKMPEIAGSAPTPPEKAPGHLGPDAGKKETGSHTPPRIAVAMDEAFRFYYEDNLELLRECGAELIFFSPIHDKCLPEADGLLLGGGYPELHAKALAENASMRASIRAAAADNMPILAECGGFMYLQEYLEMEPEDLKPEKSDLENPEPVPAYSMQGEEDAAPSARKSRRFAMCGVLPGTCRWREHLVRFGYLELSSPGEAAKTEAASKEGKGAASAKGKERASAEKNGTASLKGIEGRRREQGGGGRAGYLSEGHRIRGHEFHYFDSTANGDACIARKPGRDRSWPCMVVRGNLMAGFPHLYYRSDPAFARNFVDRCREYGGRI